MCLIQPVNAEPVENRGETWPVISLTQPITDKGALVYNTIFSNDFTDGDANLFRYNEVYYEHNISHGVRLKLGVAHLRLDGGEGVEEWHIFPGVITNHVSPTKKYSLYTWARFANIHRVGESGDAVQVHLRINPRYHFGKNLKWTYENRVEWLGHLNDREWGRRQGTFQARIYPNITYRFNDAVSVRSGYQMSYFPNNNSGSGPELRHAWRAELFLTNPTPLFKPKQTDPSAPSQGPAPDVSPNYNDHRQWHSREPLPFLEDSISFKPPKSFASRLKHVNLNVPNFPND